MSSGQSEFGEDPPKFKEYYNLILEKKDWCKYFKDCPIKSNIPGCYCWICRYAEKLDIPNLLIERGRK